jgi:hypothetical protein
MLRNLADGTVTSSGKRNDANELQARDAALGAMVSLLCRIGAATQLTPQAA